MLLYLQQINNDTGQEYSYVWSERQGMPSSYETHNLNDPEFVLDVSDQYPI